MKALLVLSAGFFLSIAIVFVLSGISWSGSESTDGIESSGRAPWNVEYKQVIVGRGDTLWSLARQHGPQGRDIRDTVYRIRRINELDGALLYPGQTIMVPVE